MNQEGKSILGDIHNDALLPEHVVNVVADLISRERFDVVAEILHIVWNDEYDIDWKSESAGRMIEYVSKWVAEICSIMYKDADDDNTREQILRTSHMCMMRKTDKLKRVCYMYHEYKRAELELLMSLSEEILGDDSN
jgi:hypothetical protein